MKVAPTLVVAPLNTFDSWQEKYASQAPEADVIALDRKNRPKFVQQIMKRSADVYLMHWDGMRLMPELARFDFNTIIADEVHKAAGRKSQQTEALKHLRSVFRLGLSGTASGDQPQNLWSVLNWLRPRDYPSYWNFVKYYCRRELDDNGNMKIIGVKNLDILHREMEPFYVRHLKREKCCEHHPNGVMEWLPDKVYDTIWVDLTPQQRRVYEQMKKNMVAWIGEHEGSPLVASAVVAQLTRLQQIAIASPRIDVVKKRKKIDDELVEVDVQVVNLELPSSKIDAATQVIMDHPEKSFVVFSSSKKACYLLEEKLTSLGLKGACGVFSGDTPDGERNRLKSSFVQKKVRVLIGSIAAMSEGVDGLQEAADTAIFLDRSWRGSLNKQAEDRLHREKQKNTVQIIDIMARNTIDQGRNQQIDDKWSTVKAMLGDRK